MIEPPNGIPNFQAHAFRFRTIHSHSVPSLPIASISVRSGTLIDIELKRDEFTAAIEPPFRKGNHEFETGEGAADLSDAEGSG